MWIGWTCPLARSSSGARRGLLRASSSLVLYTCGSRECSSYTDCPGSLRGSRELPVPLAGQAMVKTLPAHSPLPPEILSSQAPGHCPLLYSREHPLSLPRSLFSALLCPLSLRGSA